MSSTVLYALKICNSKACSGKQIPNHITTLMDSKDNLMWASNSDVSDLRELMIQGVFGLEFRDDSLEYITKQIPFWGGNVHFSSM